MEKNPKKLINDLAEKEEKKLDCEYDFLDEQRVIDEKLYFIERVDKVLTTVFTVNCILFALPMIVRMFIDLEVSAFMVFMEGFVLKGVILAMCLLGCQKHNNIFTIIGFVLSMLSIMSYENTQTGAVMRVIWFIMFSNVIFFAVQLVLCCTSIAVNVKFNDLKNHRESTSFQMIDSKRDFDEHMAKMERTRKYFREEEKLNADIFDPKKTAGSADLGSERDKTEHFMDEI